MKKNTPKLHRDVKFSSTKMSIEKWVTHFIETDFPNRFITTQAIEVFTKAYAIDIPVPKQYNHLVNESLLKSKAVKRQSSVARKAL
jgi:hypothetical protein